jgi:hypothetical protein
MGLRFCSLSLVKNSLSVCMILTVIGKKPLSSIKLSRGFARERGPQTRRAPRWHKGCQSPAQIHGTVPGGEPVPAAGSWPAGDESCKDFNQSAQGCAERATLGSHPPTVCNPERVEFMPARRREPTLSGLIARRDNSRGSPLPRPTPG